MDNAAVQPKYNSWVAGFGVVLLAVLAVLLCFVIVRVWPPDDCLAADDKVVERCKAAMKPAGLRQAEVDLEALRRAVNDAKKADDKLAAAKGRQETAVVEAKKLTDVAESKAKPAALGALSKALQEAADAREKLSAKENERAAAAEERRGEIDKEISALRSKLSRDEEEVAKLTTELTDARSKAALAAREADDAKAALTLADAERLQARQTLDKAIAGNVKLSTQDQIEGLSLELRFLIVMALVGGVGGCFHGFWSWVTYWGRKELDTDWMPWLLVRPLAGALMAMIFYWVLRGGLITPGTTSSTQGVNFHGFVAISALVGLCTHQAADKLREIFEALFKRVREESGGVLLHEATPRALTVTQAKAGLEIELKGAGFSRTTTVLVEGKGVAPVQPVGPTVLKVKLAPRADAKVGDTIELQIEDSTTKARSAVIVLKVVKDPTLRAPAATDVIEATQIAAGGRLTLKGTGFSRASRVLFGNDKPLEPVDVAADGESLTFAMRAFEHPIPAKVEIKVKDTDTGITTGPVVYAIKPAPKPPAITSTEPATLKGADLATSGRAAIPIVFSGESLAAARSVSVAGATIDVTNGSATGFTVALPVIAAPDADQKSLEFIVRNQAGDEVTTRSIDLT